jgi:hypothetical protein
MVKVKLPLCFNLAPHHEGVLEEWMYSSMHSWPRQYMEMRGQSHDPAALPFTPWKKPLVPIG